MPDAPNHELRGGRALDRDAHGAKGVHGRQAVLARQETTNLRDSLRDAPQHYRAVRDRLVPRHDHIGIADCRWPDQVVHGFNRP